MVSKNKKNLEQKNLKNLEDLHIWFQDLLKGYSSEYSGYWLAAAAAKSLQSCLTVRLQRWQPTRLPRPWDSPGKNTGVGCHFLLQCMKVKSESEIAQSCPTPSDPMDCSRPGSSVHGIFQARVLEWGAIEGVVFYHIFFLSWTFKKIYHPLCCWKENSKAFVL